MLFFSSIAYANDGECRKIKRLVVNNGTNSIEIEEGNANDLADLSNNFYLEATINGNGKGAKEISFLVTNLDTKEAQNHTDSDDSYRFPANNKKWSLGNGNFQVDANLFSSSGTLCDSNRKTFTITNSVEDCGKVKRLVFTNGPDHIEIIDGSTYDLANL